MEINSNLIHDIKKNNDEKNYYSVKGFSWNEKSVKESDVMNLQENLNLDKCIAKLAAARGISSLNFNNFITPN